jgi:hypothetical protein
VISAADDLYRLIYASRILPICLEDLDGHLASILDVAIRRNRARGVTGLLVAYRGWFVQALEGPAEVVRDAYAEIRDDLRHQSPTILIEGAVPARMFAAWPMCARVLSKADAAVLDAVRPKATFDPRKAPQRAVMRLLTIVAEVHAHRFEEQQQAAA